MRKALVASLLGATAAGCGGGSASTTAVAVPAATPAPSPSPSPAPAPSSAPLKGVFHGTITNSRNFDGVVLADGSLYGVYSAAGNASLVAGLLQGVGNSSGNTTFTSGSVKDFNAEGLGVRDASLSANYEADLRFNGTVTYAVASISPLVFSSAIFSGSGATDVSGVAGTYVGSYADVPGTRTILNLTLDAAGNLTASTTNGCRISGQISPISIANTFNVSFSFGAAPCNAPGRAYTGALAYTSSSRLLVGGTITSDRSSAAAFILTKQ